MRAQPLEAVGADEGRTTLIQDSYTGWWGSDEKAYGDTHHSKGGNYVFFDGHAKWLRWNQVGDDSTPEWRAMLEPGFDPQ